MRAIFIIAPVIGHYNPTFQFAKNLKENGFVITFTGPESYRSLIASQGFNFYELNSVPFGIGFEEIINEKKNSNKFWETFIDKLNNSLIKRRRIDLERLIKHQKPSYIFLDVFNSTDFIILYPFLDIQKIKLAFIQTMLSTYKTSSIPPLNSHILIDNKIRIYLSWKAYFFRRLIRRIFNKILYIGNDNLSLIKKELKRNKLPSTYNIDLNKTFHVGFKNVPELVLAPLEFDYPQNNILPYQKYLGPLIDLNRKDIGIDLNYGEKIKKINELKISSLKKYPSIIYCSLGTQHIIHSKKSELFMNRVIDAFKENPDYILIISTGESLDLQCPSENILIFKKVPQIELLSKCDIFITHGGLNSIVESILLEVPMLVYPLNSKWDQNGNSSRVVHHKIGLRGNIDKDTKNDILTKIEMMIENAEFKKNIIRMNKQLKNNSNHLNTQIISTIF